MKTRSVLLLALCAGILSAPCGAQEQENAKNTIYLAFSDIPSMVVVKTTPFGEDDSVALAQVIAQVRAKCTAYVARQTDNSIYRADQQIKFGSMDHEVRVAWNICVREALAEHLPSARLVPVYGGE